MKFPIIYFLLLFGFEINPCYTNFIKKILLKRRGNMAAFFKGNKVVYALSMLALACVLVFSAFSNEVQAASKFKDVSENYWAYPAIKELTDEQIILGYTDGSFKPHAAVTRAQSAMFI